MWKNENVINENKVKCKSSDTTLLLKFDNTEKNIQQINIKIIGEIDVTEICKCINDEIYKCNCENKYVMKLGNFIIFQQESRYMNNGSINKYPDTLLTNCIEIYNLQFEKKQIVNVGDMNKYKVNEVISILIDNANKRIGVVIKGQVVEMEKNFRETFVSV